LHKVNKGDRIVNVDEVIFQLRKKEVIVLRKMLTKEVTSTTIKIGKIEMVDGTPQVATLENVVLLGNVSHEKAQKEVEKLHGKGVTVFELQSDTKVYEMPVEEFIKVASLKVEE